GVPLSSLRVSLSVPPPVLLVSYCKVTAAPNPGFAGSSHSTVGVTVLLQEPLQAWKPPRAKSLSTAETESEERVSSKKLAKHSLARFKLVMSITPSKKSCAGTVQGTLVQFSLVSLFE